MKEATQEVMNDAAPLSDQGVVDIKYQKNLNMPLIMIGLPVFLCFTCFFFWQANYAQAGFFSGLSITSAGSLFLSYRIRDLKKLSLLKQIGAIVTFALLGGSILTGLWTDDIYIAYPWIFFYPVTTVLFFSNRTGIVAATLFCLVAAFTMLHLDYPAWNAAFRFTFKLNSVLTLIVMLLIALVSENSRVRMRNHLLETRNKHREAEERERRSNADLKNEIDMRLESEKALAQSETRYRALFEESAISLWEENWSAVKAQLDSLPSETTEDLEGYLKSHPEKVKQLTLLSRITAVNRATLQLYEADSLPHLLKHISTILPMQMEAYMAQRITGLHRKRHYEGQAMSRSIGGRGLHVLVSSTIPAGYEKSWERVFTSVYDITERVTLEEEKKRVDHQVQHTRQIQAVASLAGGIAHQFNNALAVICGNLDLLELDPQGPGSNNRFIGSLRTSTERIRGLTEQLIAYARGGKYQPKDICINELIGDLLKISKIAHNPSIKIATRFEKDVLLTGGDTTQIRSVLEAVLANAVEALPDGGEVVITTSSRVLKEGLKGPDAVLPSGHYTLIAIEDHGIGMDEETRRRVFEPFFSTKFVGRGLGMAAAHGIVRNHNGMIDITSEPGKGTQVMIYLPGGGPTPPTAHPSGKDM